MLHAQKNSWANSSDLKKYGSPYHVESAQMLRTENVIKFQDIQRLCCSLNSADIDS